MKNDELETPLESSRESPDKNIDRKGMERLHKNIKDTLLKHRIPWRKRVGGRENKGNLGTDETNTVEKNWYLILRMLKWSDPLEKKHTGEKDWQDNLDDQ